MKYRLPSPIQLQPKYTSEGTEGYELVNGATGCTVTLGELGHAIIFGGASELNDMAIECR